MERANGGLKISDGNGNVIVLPWQAIAYAVSVLLFLGSQLALLGVNLAQVSALQTSNERMMVTTATLVANQNALRDRIATIERRYEPHN